MGFHVVQITANGYDTNPLNVQQGDTVIWINVDATPGASPHSATADDGTFNTLEFNPGDSRRVQFNTAPKSTTYHDIHYPANNGIINVT